MFQDWPGFDLKILKIKPNQFNTINNIIRNTIYQFVVKDTLTDSESYTCSLCCFFVWLTEQIELNYQSSIHYSFATAAIIFRMSQGRCSATFSTVMMLCLLVLHSWVADAAIFTVGGASGWTFNTNSWPNGKRFRAGDILVFNYLRSISPQRRCREQSWLRYDKCTTPRGSKVYQTGKDKIKLVKGQNNFICSFPGHCQSRMNIAITVWPGHDI